jgi:hypothetical protein
VVGGKDMGAEVGQTKLGVVAADDGVLLDSGVQLVLGAEPAGDDGVGGRLCARARRGCRDLAGRGGRLGGCLALHGRGPLPSQEEGDDCGEEQRYQTSQNGRELAISSAARQGEKNPCWLGVACESDLDPQMVKNRSVCIVPSTPGVAGMALAEQ